MKNKYFDGAHPWQEEDLSTVGLPRPFATPTRKDLAKKVPIPWQSEDRFESLGHLGLNQKNEDLDKAVIRLQEELQNIYKLNYEGVAGIRRPDWSKVSIGSAATPNIAGKGGGGKRRRTKKRKNYKKRRSAKHR